MRKRTSTELRLRWEVDQISHATEFTVVRCEGRDGDKVRHEVSSLETALELAEFVGPGRLGQRPMIYAVTESRMSIHVDERHLKMLEERKNDTLTLTLNP